MKQGNEAVKETKDFIDKATKCPKCGRRYDAFLISRIPKKTRKEFQDWCKEELCDDYGMGLKWLWDFFTGALGKGSERAEAKADAALEQIAMLEQKEGQKEKKTVTMCDGKEKVIR